MLASALTRFVVTVASLGALAVLWRYRPGWPDFPDSLASPVTTVLLQQLAAIAAWMLAALLALVVLARSFSRAQPRPVVDQNGVGLRAGVGYSRTRRLRPFTIRPAAVEARLVVAERHEIAPKPPSEGVAPIAADADPAERPLISLLGPLTIRGAKQSRRGLRARALELIAFLALRCEGAQRDEILEALWPGEDPNRSRHRLYQAVRDARRLLGDVVASERDRYWLDRDRVRVDVDELEEVLDQLNTSDSGRQTKLVESALALFRDEPLAGCDYAWSDGRVRSLRGSYVELMKRVGHARLGTGDARGALHVAERGLAVDALDEEMWRLALEAEGALGLREAVEERYARLRDVLRERLALEPAKETRTLYLRLLGQS